MAQFDEWGREIPDPRPVEVPLGFRRPPSLQEQMKQFIRSQEFAKQFQGKETFQEANDFDVDDPDGADLPLTPAEHAAMMGAALAEEDRSILQQADEIMRRDRGEAGGWRGAAEGRGGSGSAVSGDRAGNVGEAGGKGAGSGGQGDQAKVP